MPYQTTIAATSIKKISLLRVPEEDEALFQGSDSDGVADVHEPSERRSVQPAGRGSRTQGVCRTTREWDPTGVLGERNKDIKVPMVHFPVQVRFSENSAGKTWNCTMMNEYRFSGKEVPINQQARRIRSTCYTARSKIDTFRFLCIRYNPLPMPFY